MTTRAPSPLSLGTRENESTVNTGFGLYKYKTANVGDEIQSIAARRFLPQIDQYIDRDGLAEFTPRAGLDQVKLIANGWYSHAPQNWPPRSDALEPLLVSMHITQVAPKVVASFLSPQSRAYFKKHGPVGARDLATHEWFSQNGIASYFSGCMTLTLERDSEIVRGDHILLVDVSKRVEDRVRRSTDRPVISLSIRMDPHWSSDVKFKISEYFLYLYQTAHSVVTTRLHATLPTIALGTPVAFIRQNNLHEVGRFSGLWDLMNVYDEEDFLANPEQFGVESPRPNPERHHAIRDELIDRASSFTGFIGDARHNWLSNPPNSFGDPDMMAVIGETFLSHYTLQEPRVRLAADAIKQLKNVNASFRKRIGRR